MKSEVDMEVYTFVALGISEITSASLRKPLDIVRTAIVSDNMNVVKWHCLSFEPKIEINVQPLNVLSYSGGLLTANIL
jgi:hypothetical protein